MKPSSVHTENIHVGSLVTILICTESGTRWRAPESGSGEWVGEVGIGISGTPASPTATHFVQKLAPKNSTDISARSAAFCICLSLSFVLSSNLQSSFSQFEIDITQGTTFTTCSSWIKI